MVIHCGGGLWICGTGSSCLNSDSTGRPWVIPKRVHVNLTPNIIQSGIQEPDVCLPISVPPNEAQCAVPVGVCAKCLRDKARVGSVRLIKRKIQSGIDPPLGNRIVGVSPEKNRAVLGSSSRKASKRKRVTLSLALVALIYEPLVIFTPE
jgi:hypothetical protein